MKKPFLVLTCEHAGRDIPESAQSCFQTKEAHDALNSHEGYDPGAREIFDHLSGLATFSLAGEVSRLVVELNRSPHHPKVFSRFTQSLPTSTREDLLMEIYKPFRNQVLQAVSQSTPVLHLSVHTFTPELDGLARNCDLALLYDPSRSAEKILCNQFAAALKGSTFRFRRNFPYRGIADGHTTALRKLFPDPQYSGIELEVNQRWFRQPGPETDLLLNLLYQFFNSHVRLPSSNT